MPPRGRPPKGKEWNVHTGMWVVKKTRPPGAAPAGKMWNYSTGKWADVRTKSYTSMLGKRTQSKPNINQIVLSDSNNEGNSVANLQQFLSKNNECKRNIIAARDILKRYYKIFDKKSYNNYISKAKNGSEVEYAKQIFQLAEFKDYKKRRIA